MFSLLFLKKYCKLPSIRTSVSDSNFNGSFTLADKTLFLGPYDSIYETSMVKLLHLCIPAVIFIFYFY